MVTRPFDRSHPMVDGLANAFTKSEVHEDMGLRDMANICCRHSTLIAAFRLANPTSSEICVIYE